MFKRQQQHQMLSLIVFVLLLFCCIILQTKQCSSFLIHVRQTNHHNNRDNSVQSSFSTRRKRTNQKITTTTTTTTTTTIPTTITPGRSRITDSNSQLYVGDAKGDYYGESAGSFMVKEFNTMEQLEEIVKLASLALPERPDGIVTVAKYTSASNTECRSTESEYERLARNNPSTLFLRCFNEYDNSLILFGQASVTILPTFDFFYGGNRVARVEGSNIIEVEEFLQRYQFTNTKLDLFSEVSPTPWGDGKNNIDYSRTPRTTARFIPGYDWNSNRGFFDTTADKMENDMIGSFENDWLPKNDNDDNKKKKK